MSKKKEPVAKKVTTVPVKVKTPAVRLAPVDALALVRPALSSRDVVAAYKCYRIGDGEVRVCDGRWSAGAPWSLSDPADPPYLIPAEELDAVLARLGGPPVFELEPDSVTVKYGRRRGRIKTVPGDGIDFMVPTCDFIEAPPGLVPALAAVRPFVSDNATKPWAACICLRGSKAYATNNVILARAETDTGYEGPEINLPYWAVDLILRRGAEGMEVGVGDGYIAFVWPDQSWMRTQLVVDLFPDSVDKILEDSAGTEIEIGDEWRDAVLRITEYAEGAVRLGAEQMVAGRGQGVLTDEVGTAVPEGAECSIWDAIMLAKVMKTATHWSPENWPRPAQWRAAGITGAIVGRVS